ncbi:F-box domain containing protein [Tanacetum coccineum]
MNGKSKDTTKARQDLKRLGIRSGLWLGQNKNGKCSKPQAAYSFTPEKEKSFSHNCHIMMQCLLLYGLQQYLPADVAKPIIELCLFFKQICSQTLMEDDMLKAQSKALEGGPIRPQWMYPFERYMKKLKNYVRNKAKPEGPIAEGYVAEEALTFSSHYFWDVTTKFNRPDCNVDCPPPTYQFQVFRSVCKSIGLRLVIRFDHQELKKVIWYVLHNNPEIDTYWAKFKSRDERHTTQNSGICSPGDKERKMYYGQLEEILEFSYMSFKVANGESFKDDQYILATQVKQVFYLEDMARRPPNWKVIEDVNHKKFSNGGVIMVEDDYDVIHFDNSSDLTLSTSLNDLDFATLHIDGQSIDVDAPPDIIVVDEDDDIIDDEDALPHELADSDDEDLVNVDDDDDVSVMSADLARGHGSDSGGDDCPPPHHSRGKGTRKPNLGGRKAGIEQHLVKIYTDNKSSLKAEHWVANPDDGTYDMEGIRSQHPANISVADWDAQIAFWSDPKNAARCAQNARNRAKSTVICRQRSRSLAVLKDRQMESSATREYPSLIQTYFDIHTVDGVFLRDEERLLYEEMLRLQGLGTYTDDQIMAIVRRGKQRHSRCCLKEKNKQLKKQMDMIMKVVRSDDKMSQLLTQLQSQYDVGSGSGSGKGGDDEPGDDEDANEDEEDEDS